MISFIVPYFVHEDYENREEYLYNLFVSLEQQTVKNFEIIISGERPQIELPCDYRFQPVPNHEIRLGKLLNAAISIAQGEYIHFSQTDYIYSSRHFEILEKVLEPDTYMFCNSRHACEHYICRREQTIRRGDFLKDLFICAHGLDGIVEKRLIPPFNEEYKGVWTHYYIEFLGYLFAKTNISWKFLAQLEIFHPYIHESKNRVSKKESDESFPIFLEYLKTCSDRIQGDTSCLKK